MAKCACEDCDLDVWKEYDKCVLHCPKNDYSNDWNDGTLSQFYNEFKKYIINSVKNSSIYNNSVIVLLEAIADNEESLEGLGDLNEYILRPTYISFPTRDSRDYFDYLELLNLFGKIHFNYSEFYLSYLELSKVEIFFQDCIFHDTWGLYDFNILNNINNVIYQACKFHKKVSMSAYTEWEKTFNILSSSQFDYSCEFYEGIRLESIIIKKPFFNSEDNNYIPDDAKIKCIGFVNCTIEERFVLNYFSIEEFKSEKTIFKSKFEFKQNKIESLNIDDSNFEKLVDFFGSKFKKFKIYKSIFNNFVGFEKCEFGSFDLDEEHIAHFEYVTFLDFTNFRNTKFKSGLNIENINLKEYPNFLNAEIDEFNTNRESFRVLKYSFDKNGNYLEGNKYFSLEMKKYGEELYLSPLKGHVQEKLVFWVNEKVSYFGQSWGRPVTLIMLFIILYGLVIYGNEHTWLMDISPKASEILNTIVQWLNYPLKKFRPLEKILKTDYEFISLIFNIIFSVLIWQTIVAVKRYTKR